MKYLHTLLIVTVFVFTSCNEKANSFKEVAPQEFAQRIRINENAQILDVRTPDEFESEHIDNAVNINWNSEDFAKKTASLDKSKPVFVYCLSGGRSKKAAKKLNELGFENVYELDGGIISWNAEGLSKSPASEIGMSQEDFNKLLNTDKKVIVDFYAEWCGPCKQMEPYLLKMQKEMADKVTIIRIDVDKNKSLATEMKIDQLPTLVLYENKNLKWKTVGYISEQDLKKQLQ